MTKRILAILLCLALVLGLTACTNGNGSGDSDGNKGGFLGGIFDSDNKGDDKNEDGGNKKDDKMTKDYTDPSIYTMDTLVSMGIEEKRPTNKDVDKKAAQLLKEIENNPDTMKPKAGGKTIYVANNGTDAGGYGFSEDKPFATIGYANLVAKEGDVVLLKRSNFWREKVVCVAGVSYGAYGKGNKPTIYGAPRNAAEQKWSLDGQNIYRTAIGSGLDVGLIVFDHGKAVASKKFNKEDLKNNYDFYCVGGMVYVYCTDGNPADLYSDIEICVTEHIVKLKANSTIQNWRIMYGGAHGISITGSPPNVTVDGCVVGYIGGGIQGGVGLGNVRYGNGIEVWGGCNGYTIKNSHVFQCYDAGITMQYAGNLDEKNILFENNLLEYSVYNIEYFLNNGTGKLIDVMIKDNIIRHGGYGWGYYSRSDKNKGTNVMGRGQNLAENFVFKNNIFDHSKSFLIEIQATEDQYLPKFEGNTYLQYTNARICMRQGKNFSVQRQGMGAITDGLGDATGKFVDYGKKG